jgi:TadE-like protein
MEMTTMTRMKSERGAALLEAAITIPILLLISIGIFEFGRAWQTWQVLTNAAREGARVAVLPDPTPGVAEQRTRDYMEGGQLKYFDSCSVVVDREATIVVNGENVPASRVTIDYPFAFKWLQPVVKLVRSDTAIPGDLTIHAEAVMRNE